jgi:cation-transporting ATPase E
VHSPVRASGLTGAEVAERTASGDVNLVARRTSRPAADIVRANVLTLFNAIVGTLVVVILLTGNLSCATAIVGLAAVAGLDGLRFPFLPRHLTLISTLTIGAPAFVLALAPNLQRAAPGFVHRVLSFAIPAGIACGAATFCSYLIARLGVGASLAADRTTAVITLSVAAIWVLALVARPYTWWRVGLVAAMAAGMVLAFALPFTRSFFALRSYVTTSDVIAIAIAAAAGIVLTVFLAAAGRLPGQPDRGGARQAGDPAGVP